MYIISNYAKLYNPTDTKGGKLINAKYVKMPIKPRGKGLRALLRNDKGLEILGVWTLLLQAASETTNPELRGMLLNHKDEPANIEEIADSISLGGDAEVAKNAIDVLITLNWINSVPDTDLLRTNSVLTPYNTPPKLKVKISEENLTKPKGPLGFSLTEKSLKKLFSDELEPSTQYEINTLNKLARYCHERKAVLPNLFTFLINEIADLKEHCKVKNKNHGDLMRMFVKKVQTSLK
jgi:hypothetical protein